MNKGQKGSTQLIIARGNAAELFELIEKPLHFLAQLVLLFIIPHLLGALRLAWHDRFDALIFKHLTDGITVIRSVHDGSVKRGEGGSLMPHKRKARGIVTCSTGQDEGDPGLFLRTGGMQLGGKSAPRAAKSLGLLAAVFFRAPAAC